MSRRMISPNVLIKSQVVDDYFFVNLNEIIEKYGTVTDVYGGKTITLQIYNKKALDEQQNLLRADGDLVGNVVVNGSITITKEATGNVLIQGMLVNSNGVYIPYLDISSGDYGDGVLLECESDRFDLYVIRV